MKTLSLFRQRVRSHERGATIFIIVGVILILLMMGAMAVDLSAKGDRGQDLQGAADSAALAAAKAWNSTGDIAITEAAIQAMLDANGVDPSVTFTAVPAGGTDVTVTLTDPSYVGLFSGVSGEGSGIVREATGRQDECLNNCNHIVETPPIRYPVTANGDGDGFTPIQVGDRFYSINHHQRGADCVDTNTRTLCFSSKTAFNSNLPADMITPTVHNPTAVGTKIYFTGNPSGLRWQRSSFDNDAGSTALTCFDTTTDNPCLDHADLGIQGHGSIAVIGTDIYVLTASGRIFCYAASNFSPCADYGVDGRDGPMITSPGVADWLDEWEAGGSEHSAWSSHRLIDGSKIYHTIYGQNRVWLQCWDITGVTPAVTADPNATPPIVGSPAMAGAPCWTDPAMIPTASGYWQYGRNSELMFNRAPSATSPQPGAITSICVYGRQGIPCFNHLTGSGVATPSGLTNLRAFMNIDRDATDKVNGAPAGTLKNWPTSGWEDHGWSAASSYHAPSNRQYIVDARGSWTYCYDFNTANPCPDAASGVGIGIIDTFAMFDFTPSDDTDPLTRIPAQTYGYIEDPQDPNCLIGLGDNSIFHTMKVDLTGPCDTSFGDIDITPCQCNTGSAVWPQLEAIATTGVIEFRVRVGTTTGTPLLPSANENDWHDLMADGPLDIDVQGTYTELRVHFDLIIDTNAPNPWLAGTPPTFIVNGNSNPPQLVG